MTAVDGLHEAEDAHALEGVQAALEKARPVFVGPDGAFQRITHVLPEARPGAQLEEIVVTAELPLVDKFDTTTGALLSATETLVVTYTGANEHSGAPRPPAVPLGEVLDAADRTCATPVREHVLTHHPLQPYDARNLAPGGLLAHDPPIVTRREARGLAVLTFNRPEARNAMDVAHARALYQAFLDFELVSEWSFQLSGASVATQLVPYQVDTLDECKEILNQAK